MLIAVGLFHWLRAAHDVLPKHKHRPLLADDSKEDVNNVKAAVPFLSFLPVCGAVALAGGPSAKDVALLQRRDANYHQ